MTTFVLISCGKTKNRSTAPLFAVQRYTGDLFKKSLAYARTLTSDKNIFILSAKYFVLNLYQHTHDYDLTLNKMSIDERLQWSAMVSNIIRHNVTKIEPPYHFVVLAGQKYIEFIEDDLNEIGTVERPLKGLGIGQQLKWLKEAVT